MSEVLMLVGKAVLYHYGDKDGLKILEKLLNIVMTK